MVTGEYGPLSGEYTCGMLCDLLHLEGAEQLAVYGDDFYAGMPSLTVNSYGEGKAYYVATDGDDRFLADLVALISEQSGLQAPFRAEEGVELVQRRKGDRVFTFVLNHLARPAKIDLDSRYKTREALTC